MSSITVIPDGHYYRSKNGDIYSNGVYSSNFFERYLVSFDKVIVIARISDIDFVPLNLKLSSGHNIEFKALPNYKGPLQYLKQYYSIKRELKKYLSLSDAVVVRAPSTLSSLAVDLLSSLDIPWGMEVVVDPWEYFAPGTVESILRPIYRYKWTRDLKNSCKRCKCVSYVTESYLQRKYPCKAHLLHSDNCFTNHYSSVEISDNSISLSKDYGKSKLNQIHLIHVAANLEGYGKGHIVALNILNKLISKNYNADITFIGDGSKLEEFKNYSKKLGVYKYSRFLGRLPGVDSVRAELKKADVFLFPTKAEGLPRVLIEAMAEGLPCLSTPVCGIPELLDNDWMFNFNDVDGFVNKIISCIEHPEYLNIQSKRNIKIAHKYERTKLQIERKKFLDFLNRSVMLYKKGRNL